MIVVSDTSVISALIQVGHADLLPEIFGGVVIPERVAEELAVSHPVPLPWLRVMAVRDRSAVAKLAERLDEGESEAIVLAAELEADYLLMDERKGRAVARQAGIRLIGVLGLVALAKKLGLVASVADVIARLKDAASFRISAELEARILRDAGE